MLLAVERDYFTDRSILDDPNAFFDEMLGRGSVYRSQLRDVVFVSGFAEALAVLGNAEDFSSLIAAAGPVTPLPFVPSGSDIAEQIELHRAELSANELMVTYDGPPHAAARALLSRLFVPSRLKANEAFMVDYADRQVRSVVAQGRCEFVKQMAQPFVTLVIADLLGVPEEDRPRFVAALDAAPPPGNLNAPVRTENLVLKFIGGVFRDYIASRRATPRDDLLSELANARYPDDTIPDIDEVVRLATVLFAAGQDTSAKLLGSCLRFLVEDKALQSQLRANLALVPNFIEEVLRLEGSSKITSRLARRDTRIGDMAITAGTRVTIFLSGANRDPRRWEEPAAFKLDRPRAREHVAFGRGAHTCIGAPLARAELRVLLTHLLAQTADISLCETEHGPPGARRLDYEPSFIIRGLTALHLELTPASQGQSWEAVQ